MCHGQACRVPVDSAIVRLPRAAPETPPETGASTSVTSCLPDPAEPDEADDRFRRDLPGVSSHARLC